MDSLLAVASTHIFQQVYNVFLTPQNICGQGTPDLFVDHF